MRRPIGYASVAAALVAAVAAGVVRAATPLADLAVPALGDTPPDAAAATALLACSVALAANGAYLVVSEFAVGRTTKRRAHDVRNVLRLVFGGLALAGVLGVLTDQWVGLLVSLGVVGVAITFALQQPLLSLVGWFYLVVKRPYAVGDRVQLGDVSGDVVEVDFLVTTLWEVNGPLVSTNQPSGRVVTVPNSLVLSSEAVNFAGAGSPYVYNELSVQVAYETDLEFARERMAGVAADYLGEEMGDAVDRYRDRLDETAVDLDVADGPSVNVVQRESWVELRLRYLVHHRRATRVRNALYERVLAEFNEAPDRVAFPVSRNR
ncbi:mechanosensitive ion channel family protein [Halobaculum magnesiiphilum]|uniref:Mechanosensitive ion channel family protein n=1 Tax=Halobaculum magnesiiphilum TaxID=1017351 RepID=A0A8T8WE31_9EURY|nr:mechanosensitive ion channel domain-containing protein [Halobaculum magnesiiphilum]QZP37984.1 mechanosensitive ion channel family protein [Halobaculum magnesiiphilum]